MKNGSFPITTNEGKSTFRGTIVNRYFAVSPEPYYRGRYRLTHLPTGLSACRGVKGKDAAIRLARALTIKLGKNWNFTDENFTTKHRRMFVGAKELIRKATRFNQASSERL